jgi:hypothetical protein
MALRRWAPVKRDGGGPGGGCADLEAQPGARKVGPGKIARCQVAVGRIGAGEFGSRRIWLSGRHSP